MMADVNTLVDRVRDTALVRRVSQQIPALEKRIGRTRTSEPYVDFEVTGGLHSGAKLEFGESAFTVGSSVEADIVLNDPGVADIHARLRIVDDRVEMEALGGSIEAVGSDSIPEGYGRRSRLPLEIGVGGATLSLVDTRPPRSIKPPFSNRTFMIAVGLAAAVFAVPVASNTLSASSTSEKASEANGLLANSKRADEASPGEGASPAQKARDALKVQMEQAGLGNLSVKAAQGRVVVSGSLPDNRAGAWESVQAWFDEVHGGRIMLMSNVATGDVSEAPRLPLQAIWYGERPYIITADGARYHEGAFVDGGWIIKKIGEEQLLLAKNGTEMALNYR